MKPELPKTRLSRDDFIAFLPRHSYIYRPTREMWPATSVNVRLGKIDDMAASTWLDQNRHVEQMTWVPGKPELIRDQLIREGAWIRKVGDTCFNLYRPPTVELGDASKATPWLDHVAELFGDDADHIVRCLAHRVQRPGEKINHGLLIIGEQGIGKDTMLEPIKHIVGPWNFSEVSPQHMLGRFNGFVKSVILRVSEARDLGDVNRYQFYEHMKTYMAAPPDVLRVDEKHLREHSVINCVGIIITSNHKTDGIYLPSDDRRHYVAWSDLKQSNFRQKYWNEIWGFYNRGGIGHVAAYLSELDLSDFDPKAPPKKTQAFWAIVDANRAPEDAELADALDKLQQPDAVTLRQLVKAANGVFRIWLNDRRNRRIIPHRLEQCDYVAVRNDTAKDGLWKVNGARQVIYAKKGLSIQRQMIAARELIDDASGHLGHSGQ